MKDTKSGENINERWLKRYGSAVRRAEKCVDIRDTSVDGSSVDGCAKEKKRKTEAKMDGEHQRWHEREGTVGRGGARPGC